MHIACSAVAHAHAEKTPVRGSSYTLKAFPGELNMLNMQDFTKVGKVSKSHSALSSRHALT